jgi:hypothetical protein
MFSHQAAETFGHIMENIKNFPYSTRFISSSFSKDSISHKHYILVLLKSAFTSLYSVVRRGMLSSSLIIRKRDYEMVGVRNKNSRNSGVQTEVQCKD